MKIKWPTEVINVFDKYISVKDLLFIIFDYSISYSLTLSSINGKYQWFNFTDETSNITINEKYIKLFDTKIYQAEDMQMLKHLHFKYTFQILLFDYNLYMISKRDDKNSYIIFDYRSCIQAYSLNYFENSFLDQPYSHSTTPKWW